MIFIILYILYLILSKTYYEYKINSHIEAITNINQSIKEKIHQAQEIIEYKSSKAYKNKILKEQQSFKNKWEKVVYLTTQSKYEKFTTKKEDIIKPKEEIIIKNDFLDNMTISEKWIYLIFKKDTY